MELRLLWLRIWGVVRQDHVFGGPHSPFDRCCIVRGREGTLRRLSPQQVFVGVTLCRDGGCGLRAEQRGDLLQLVPWVQHLLLLSLIRCWWE